MILIRKSILLLFLSLLMLPDLYAQRTVIAGKITDSKGIPVPSASVRIKSNGRGTSSDNFGAFSLRIQPNDSIVVSAVGFSDTTVIAGNRTALTIMLLPRSKALQEAIVTSVAAQNDNSSSPLEATTEQIITGAFDQYNVDAAYSTGQFRATSIVPNPPPPQHIAWKQAQIKQVSTTINGFGPLNGLNAGTLFPIMEHKDDTKGSRYLLKNFAYGLIVDNTGKVIADSIHLMNFDKIDGQLMIAQDTRNYLEVDKEKVVAFAFKTPDTSFIFLNVPLLSKVNYFILIASGQRYSVYKSVRSKFTKANYISNGLTESGHNYDEYVDTETYFWVAGKESAGVFELKKKSIKAAFANEKTRVDDYFAKHKLDDIDDHFIKGLIDSLNAPR